MRTRHSGCIPIDRDQALFLMMEASLQILRRSGRTVVDAQGTALVAYVNGYTFRYYAMLSDAEADATLTIPSAVEGETTYPSRAHCIDVEASELLYGLAIGPQGLSYRRLVRGPWEYEIARIAGLDQHPHRRLPLPPCNPEYKSRWSWPISDLQTANKRRLRTSLPISVTGYTQCIHSLLPAGSNHADIAAIIADGYWRSRSYDNHQRMVEEACTTSFGLWAWLGDRPVRLGKRMTKPDLAYWISPTGGFKAAASLLLLLDKELFARTPRIKAVEGTATASQLLV